MDFLQDFIFILLSKIQIPTQLQVHPEISRHIKEFCQAQSRAWRYAPAPIDNFIDALIGNMNIVSQVPLTDSHWAKKLFQKHFAWMSRYAACRNANHSLSPGYPSSDNQRSQPGQDLPQSTQNKSEIGH